MFSSASTITPSPNFQSRMMARLPILPSTSTLPKTPGMKSPKSTRTSTINSIVLSASTSSSSANAVSILSMCSSSGMRLGILPSMMAAMTSCSSVPSAAYLLSTWGGILATIATLPGQLMTRLAVLPPTILECVVILRLFNEGCDRVVAVALQFVEYELVAKRGADMIQEDRLDVFLV